LRLCWILSNLSFFLSTDSSGEEDEEESLQSSPPNGPYEESTPVEPFSTSENQGVNQASGSSSSASLVSSSNPEEEANSNEGEAEPDEFELIRYHKSILKLFDVGDRTKLSVAGMNADSNSVEDFYFVSLDHWGNWSRSAIYWFSFTPLTV